MSNFSKEDYLSIARSRYTQQFSNKHWFNSLLRVYIDQLEVLQKIFLEELTILSIDQSSGAQLDNLGEILGQPRELVGLETYGFFGFENDASALSFGSVENGDGGYFYSLRDTSSGVIKLKDDLYRNLLKVKAISNNTGVTPDDVIEATKILFQAKDVIYKEESTAEFSLTLADRRWSDPKKTNFPGFDETVLAKRFLPRPLGVLIKFVNP